jgi:hypothetical protein
LQSFRRGDWWPFFVILVFADFIVVIFPNRRPIGNAIFLDLSNNVLNEGFRRNIAELRINLITRIVGTTPLLRILVSQKKNLSKDGRFLSQRKPQIRFAGLAATT